VLLVAKGKFTGKSTGRCRAPGNLSQELVITACGLEFVDQELESGGLAALRSEAVEYPTELPDLG
jgi:hypothetical protein